MGASARTLANRGERQMGARHVVPCRSLLAAAVGTLGVIVLALALSTPAKAQVNLAAEWKPIFYQDWGDRIPGPLLGDYLGLPINQAARYRANAWSATMEDMIDYQCRPHGLDYIFWGPSQFQITQHDNPLTRQITWHVYWLRNPPQDLIIHVGKPPQESALAPHSWFGFDTGRWVGDMLRVTATHLKFNFIKRNGAPASVSRTDVMYFIRHRRILTVFVIVYDPTFLTAPFTRTISFQEDDHQFIPPYPCEGTLLDVQRRGVPHYQPGHNPNIYVPAEMYHLPFAVTQGGADEMYPQFMQKLAKMMNMKEYDAWVLKPPLKPLSAQAQGEIARIDGD